MTEIKEVTMAQKITPREIAMNNYQSIVVGLLVFLIGLGVSYKLVTNQLNKVKQQEAAMTEQQEQKVTHTVVAGETLWSIAEKEIGSGYNAPDIAKANNIADPNQIEVGTKLTIPEVSPIMEQHGSVSSIRTTQVTLNEANYTIKDGDTLWDISVRAYGDGYRWPEIAKTNRLSNPNLIYAGDLLILPGK
ncbi:MAG: LysM peptidoglycan-binding domain-containing protein [Microgenomates group bacterium]